MLVRIVKMTFKKSDILTFQTIFKLHKEKIRRFNGCHFLELYQDINSPTIFFTYSYWESKAHLDTYRNSELFKEVWKQTKPLFIEKPEAWSVNKLVSIP